MARNESTASAKKRRAAQRRATASRLSEAPESRPAASLHTSFGDQASAIARLRPLSSAQRLKQVDALHRELLTMCEASHAFNAVARAWELFTVGNSIAPQRLAPGASSAAEYLAAVLLTRPTATPVRAPTHEDNRHGVAVRRIGEVVQDIYTLRVLEAAERDGRDSPRGLSAEQALQRVFVFQGSALGSLSYMWEQEQQLQALFSPFDHVLAESLGFTTDQGSELVRSLHDHRTRSGMAVMAECAGGRAHVVHRWEYARRTGDWSDTIAASLRQSSRAEVDEAARAMAELWRQSHIGEALSFSAPELAALAGLPIDAASGFVESLSNEFGTQPLPAAKALLASPVTLAALQRVRTRPLLRSDDRYFAVDLEALTGAMKPLFEDALQHSPARQSYLDHRASYLEGAAAALLTQHLRPDAVFTNLDYARTTGDGERQTGEIDVFLRIDDTLVIVEAKSAPLGDAARRAAPLALSSDLIADLITAPVAQLDRATRALRPEAGTIFMSDGKPVELDLAGIRTVVPIVVTLEGLGGIAASSIVTRPLLGDRGDLPTPWIVSLRDLEMTCELLGPADLVLPYAWRRQAAMELEPFAAGEELDLVMGFLPHATWPRAVSATPGGLALVPDSSERIESWLFPLNGAPLPDHVPARPQPVTDLAPAFLQALRDILALRSPNWLAATRHLLALDDEARTMLLEALAHPDLTAIASTDRRFSLIVRPADGLDGDPHAATDVLARGALADPQLRVVVALAVAGGTIVAASAAYASDGER